jgi:Ca2+-binding EF-hand superfamily protein
MSATFGNYLISSTMMYAAHHDTIPKVVALSTNSCLMTVSHDGFHRLWNLDMEILGELPLPNITEQMKQTSMCTEVGTQWKFILERIPVTDEHRELAYGIVRSIKATKQEKMLEYQRQQLSSQQGNASAASSSNLTGAQKNSIPFQRREATHLNASLVKTLSTQHNMLEMSQMQDQFGMKSQEVYGMAGGSAYDYNRLTPEQQEALFQQQRLAAEEAERLSLTRKNMLTALCAPPVEVNENRPPLRLPTKEEKDLIKMTLIAQREHNQHARATSPDFHDPMHRTQDTVGMEGSLMSSMDDLMVGGHSVLGVGEAGMSVSKSTSALPTGISKAIGMTSSPMRKTTTGANGHVTAKVGYHISPAKANRQGQLSTATVSPKANKSPAKRRTGTMGGSTWSSTEERKQSNNNNHNNNTNNNNNNNGTSSRAHSPSGDSRLMSPLLEMDTSKSRTGTGSPYNRRAKSPNPKEIAALTSTLRSSIQFHSSQQKHGNDMCLSSFGLPSLWVVPGEKDIFGRTVPIGGSSLDKESAKTPMPSQTIAPAFSEASIVALHRENMIDNEGMRILRQVASKVDRVQVYDRSQPTLLVRNTAMSTSVTLPPLEHVKKTEILFGAQKDLYKNAEKVLAEKHDMNKVSIRGAVAIARIEQNVRRIHSTIHLIAPPNHDEVILPGASDGNSGDGGLDVMGEAGSKGLLTKDNEEAMMKLRLSRSDKLVPPDARARFSRPLDPDSIRRWTSKMEDALDITADSLANKAQDNARKRQRKKKETISPALMATLEKKLSQAIKGKYFSRMAKVRKQQMLMDKHAKPVNETGEILPPSSSIGTNSSIDAMPFSSQPSPAGNNGNPSPQFQIARAASMLSINSDENDIDDPDGELAAGIAALTANNKERKVVNLTTRELLPYYKLEAVIQFMDIFAKVDENFSGDLDVNEWIRLFTSLNESVPVQEARMIFMKIDKDGDGYLSMRELIPVVFGKATRAQQKKIIEFCEFELTKKIETETIPTVSLTDLDFLFEAYDTDNVGFVDVAIIRERVRKMPLNDLQVFFFMELIADLADDEMVNLQEFRRIFRIFTKSK